MEEIILEIQPREELGKNKVKDLRGKGFIPAVIYAEGKKSSPIKVAHRQLWQLIHQHRLESAVINLKMNPIRSKAPEATAPPSAGTSNGVNPIRKTSSTGAELSNGVQDAQKQKSRVCLIKEIQYDPVKGDIIHVDFNEISLTKAIKVNVPVVAKGEPVGVKQEGGSLEHILWEIEVECLPTDIPRGIEVDVGLLKIGDAVHIKDITFPSQIKVLHAPEAIVFSVTAPIKEEVAAPAVEGEEKQEPEVIKEKKEVAPEGEEAKEEKKEK